MWFYEFMCPIKVFICSANICIHFVKLFYAGKISMSSLENHLPILAHKQFMSLRLEEQRNWWTLQTVTICSYHTHTHVNSPSQQNRLKFVKFYKSDYGDDWQMSGWTDRLIEGNLLVPANSLCNGACQPASIAGAALLVPCHVKSVPDLQMSYWDLT